MVNTTQPTTHHNNNNNDNNNPDAFVLKRMNAFDSFHSTQILQTNGKSYHSSHALHYSINSTTIDTQLPLTRMTSVHYDNDVHSPMLLHPTEPCNESNQPSNRINNHIINLPLLSNKPIRVDPNDLDTEDNLMFFPANMQPIHDHGEYLYDAEQLKSMVALVKPHCKAVSEAIVIARQDEVRTIEESLNSSNTQQRIPLAKFASSHTTSSVTPTVKKWVSMILSDQCIDYSCMPTYNPSVPSTMIWTIERCAHFLIHGLLPSITVAASHMEECITDFINDFMIPKVMIPQGNAVVGFSYGLCVDLSNIIECMIKCFVSSTIVHTLLNAIATLLPQPVVTVFEEKQVSGLYETLINTMLKLPAIPSKPELKTTVMPTRPSMDDAQFQVISDPIMRESEYQASVARYEIELIECKKKISKDRVMFDRRLRQYRLAHTQKSRAFDYLKSLSTLFPSPLMMKGNLCRKKTMLCVKKRVESVSMSSSAIISDESTKRGTQVEVFKFKIMGVNPHPHQDFFDAIFFACILKAMTVLSETCLDDNDTMSESFSAHRVIENSSLDAMFNSLQKAHIIRELNDDNVIKGLRVLMTIDRFIEITRFNVVANKSLAVIESRRQLLRYMCQKVADIMSVPLKKIHSRCVALQLLSLFESLQVYQVLDRLPSDSDHDDMTAIMSQDPCSDVTQCRYAKALYSILTLDDGEQVLSLPSLQLAVMFVSYNPMKYETIVSVCDRVITWMKQHHRSSIQSIQILLEIVGMIKNVELLPIQRRKVLGRWNKEGKRMLLSYVNMA